MSDLKLPQDEKEPGRPSTSRLVIWIAAGGIGLYFVISGFIGLINSGSGG